MLRPAVFLDRDGTLIVERDYLAEPDGVELVPGTVDALRLLRRAGYALVVITNQSGIARGLYTEHDYRAVADRLDAVLADAGTPLDGSYHCPHLPEISGPCRCRKPGTGLHRQASADLGLDPSRSWFVGDKVADVLPAGELQGRGILVRTGYGAEAQDDAPKGTSVVADLAAAAQLIVGSSGGEDGVDPPTGLG